MTVRHVDVLGYALALLAWMTGAFFVSFAAVYLRDGEWPTAVVLAVLGVGLGATAYGLYRQIKRGRS